MSRSIREIAKEIREDWSKSKGGVWYGAKPYLAAMFSLDSMGDVYGMDNAKSVILYFLSNAQTWRGEVARRVKKELNAMVKG